MNETKYLYFFIINDFVNLFVLLSRHTVVAMWHGTRTIHTGLEPPLCNIWPFTLHSMIKAPRMGLSCTFPAHIVGPGMAESRYPLQLEILLTWTLFKKYWRKTRKNSGNQFIAAWRKVRRSFITHLLCTVLLETSQPNHEDQRLLIILQTGL